MTQEHRARAEYLKAEYVPQTLAEEGHEHLDLSVGRAAVSALLAGAFVTFGALLSILIPAGIETEGLKLLLQGLAFAVGYYFVALAGVALLTERIYLYLTYCSSGTSRTATLPGSGRSPSRSTSWAPSSSAG
jgi:formate/nitrite transporter FocA (FNT family)